MPVCLRVVVSDFLDSITQLERNFPRTRKGYHRVLLAQTKLRKIASHLYRDLTGTQCFDGGNGFPASFETDTTRSRFHNREIRMNVNKAFYVMCSRSFHPIRNDPTALPIISDGPPMDRSPLQSSISVMSAF